MPKKIKIFLMGQTHSNNEPLELTKQYIRQLKDTGIKVVVGFENPYNISLQAEMLGLRNTIEFTKDFVKLNQETEHLKDNQPALMQKHLAFNQYLCNKGTQYVENAFALMAQYKPHELLTMLPSSEIRLAYLEFLDKENIPFVGIDIDSQKHNEIVQQAKKIDSKDDDAFMHSKEKERLKAMTINIFQGVEQLKETGGVMFVSDLGAMHAHRLAACLWYHLKVFPIQNLDVSIIPIRTFHEDSFERDCKKIHERVRNLMHLEKEAIKTFYHVFPCLDIKIGKDRISGALTSFELDEKIREIISADKKSMFEKHAAKSSQAPLSMLSTLSSQSMHELKEKMEEILSELQEKRDSETLPIPLPVLQALPAFPALIRSFKPKSILFEKQELTWKMASQYPKRLNRGV